MEKKKALLVVVGGRIAPDVLPLFYIQPQLVIAITSKEGWRAEKAFVDAAKTIPSCKVNVIHGVDAYKLHIGIQACLDILETYPDDEWEWTFAIGSAPKITGIAAYEVAKSRGIPCWHIDTRHEEVVSLVKEVVVDKRRFFHLDVPSYMKIQKRKCEKREGDTKDYRESAEALAPLTRKLVESSEAENLLLLLRDKKKGDIVEVPEMLVRSTIVQELEEQGLLKISRINADGSALCQFASSDAARLLGTGDWLEIYVWYEVGRANFADDYQWGYKIFDGKVENELDLALTYKAQLIIAECKTEQKPFIGEKRFLSQIDAVADLLGRTYVSKVFVTNQPPIGDSYKIFVQQAKQRNIVVVTKDDLLNIGNILKNEAINPTYERT